MGGIAVLQGAEALALDTLSSIPHPIRLSFMETPERRSWLEPGGEWDRALTAGTRVAYIGDWMGASRSRVHVRSSDATPSGVLRGLRSGAAYVDAGHVSTLDLPVTTAENG